MPQDLLLADPDTEARWKNATAHERGPATAASILLPVWGTEFIAQFLDYSLPTLLAPGNIPALAEALPTRFVFLTREADVPVFREHPAFRHLEQVANVEFSSIDDLITQGNHSTTITLAYARAVRATRRAMLDTCFFFLVSDYIMADGSLAAVLARMQAGASAVQAGNFQLAEEAAEDWLETRFRGNQPFVALEPRELVHWGLSCLHPIALASTVNFPLCHNAEANRLLWRVDDETLIGRFYLLHMICIRPEVTDFVIGASCDYSFVPEMCPSGNVVTITDSDDYLVVEVQPEWHENHFIRAGAGTAQRLSASLSQWTTARHRTNARDTIVFHAGELPAKLPEVIAEADKLVAEIGTKLVIPPQPHRDHPYWLGAIRAFKKALQQRANDEANIVLPGDWQDTIGAMLVFVRTRLFGLVPEVTRVHPRWRDLQQAVAACTPIMSAPEMRVLIAANRTTALTAWMRDRMPQAALVSLRRLQRSRAVPGFGADKFDVCFIELIDNDLAEAAEFFRVVMPLMRPGGQILVFSLNDRWIVGIDIFGQRYTAHAATLACPGLWPTEMHIGISSRASWRINGACVQLTANLFQRTILLAPFRLAAAALLLPLAITANLIGLRNRKRLPRRGITSSVFIRFQVSAAAAPASTH